MVMVDATALAPGSDFGARYRIEALLGQGEWAESTKRMTRMSIV
jgi:hypothetical protein